MARKNLRTCFSLAWFRMLFIIFFKRKATILAMHHILQFATRFRSEIYRFILLGSMLFLPVLFTACTHHHTKHSQTLQGSQGTNSNAPMVEQQLLATIQNAESLGHGNPLFLSSLYSLANFYHDRKEYDKAAHQYQRALQIKEEISGPEHPDVVAILQRYGRLLQEANRPTEAANLFARADAIVARSSLPSSTHQNTR